jgi:predicted dehydrogenase
MSMSRRDFVGRSAASAAVGALGMPTFLAGASGVQSPEEGIDQPIRIGVVGLNGRGNSLMQAFHGLPNARIVALCDVDQTVLQRRASEMKTRGLEVSTHGDFREMLASDDVDAVVIATPNHWHALMAVWACDAGKDVYVEKPVSHNVTEGRAIVEAAARNSTICQTGTQSRSSHAVRSAVEFARSGAFGKVLCARGLCYKPRRSIGKANGPQFIPSTIDYHRWLGPAAYEPLKRNRLHYDWHWHDKTGNGDLGNQGVHQMDIARWGAGHDRLPDRAWSAGGRIGYDDDGNTPNTQVIVLEYDNGAPLIFEVRGLPRDHEQQTAGWAMDSHHGMGIGVVLHCEGGEVRIPTGYSRAVALDTDGAEAGRWEGNGNHQANFIEAVQANDASRLNAPIIEGHLSSACCHVGMVSHALGTESSIVDALRHAPTEPGRESVQRMSRHLSSNGLADASIVVGVNCPIDATGERSSDPAADSLFSSDCREPFTFPTRDS